MRSRAWTNAASPLPQTRDAQPVMPRSRSRLVNDDRQTFLGGGGCEELVHLVDLLIGDDAEEDAFRLRLE
jgi:hypothetical protein